MRRVSLPLRYQAIAFRKVNLTMLELVVLTEIDPLATIATDQVFVHGTSYDDIEETGNQAAEDATTSGARVLEVVAILDRPGPDTEQATGPGAIAS
jgi:hypothetical protein